MRLKKYTRSPLFHFSLSYLLILLIPLTMGFFYFWSALDMTINHTMYTNSLILRNSKDSLESSLMSIITYSRTLNQITALDDVVSNSDRGQISLLDLQEASAAFPALREDNRYVDIYFLYSHRNSIILAPNQAFLNLEVYFGHFFDFGDMTFEYWRERILRNPVRPEGVSMLPFGGGGGRLIYTTPYISHRDGRVAGQQIFLLDENRIYNAFNPAFQMGAAFMYIEDNHGNLLVTMEQDGWVAYSLGAFEDSYGVARVSIDGRPVIISYVNSPLHGWTYVIAVPMSVLRASAIRSLSPVFAVAAVLALVGVLMILCSYKYNMSPLTNIASYANKGGERAHFGKRVQNGLWHMTDFISSLVLSNSIMEERIRRQHETLRQSLLVQLATGQFIDESGLAEQLSEFGIYEEFTSICGMYLKILSGDVSDQAKEIIAAELGNAAHIKLIPCFWVDEKHLTILCLEQEESSSYMELLRDMHFQLKDMWGLETVFSLGAKYYSFTDVHTSFSEARKLLLSERYGVSILRVGEPDSSQKERFAYKSRDEDAIIEMAEAGQFNEVKQMLAKIRHVNFVKLKLDADMREMLFYRMASTLLSAGWGVELPLNKISLATINTDDFFNLMQEKYEAICTQNISRIKESRVKTQNEIVCFINDNYHNSNMSLGLLSQQFGLTESYLSMLIKGLVGENFSSYLESMRIDEANLLLEAGVITVEEAGRRVGYESSTSFGRAYKRIMGHSPSQYLKLRNKKSLQEV